MDKMPPNKFESKFKPFAKKITDGKPGVERSNCENCHKPMNGKGMCDSCKSEASYKK